RARHRSEPHPQRRSAAMNSFLELASRVAAATEAERELFELAYAAINGASYATVIYRHGDLGVEPDHERGEAARRFGEFLDAGAFLDAAMTLVPEGMILRRYMTTKHVPHGCEVGLDWAHG